MTKQEAVIKYIEDNYLQFRRLRHDIVSDKLQIRMEADLEGSTTLGASVQRSEAAAVFRNGIVEKDRGHAGHVRDAHGSHAAEYPDPSQGFQKMRRVRDHCLYGVYGGRQTGIRGALVFGYCGWRTAEHRACDDVSLYLPVEGRAQ